LAVKIAVKRHTGTIENIYTPFGAAYLQKGKDLSDIQAVIGTGGPLIYGMRRRDALAQALYDETEPTSLRPYRPALMVDRLYIMSAMGLLAERHPTTALRIMKKELEVLK
ncbi:MAG: MutL protein, partial [Clostridia bacterium]|nr:MutL protein [Clostridia bacterium]